MSEQGDKLTCATCGAEGVGIGFVHDCAIDEDNPDTCGVCGQHFTECDSDQRVRGDVTEAACAGARARETVRPIRRETP